MKRGAGGKEYLGTTRKWDGNGNTDNWQRSLQQVGKIEGKVGDNDRKKEENVELIT